MNKKQIMMATALVSTLALSGCASNDDIIEQQKQQAEQINTLDSKVNTLESQLQRQQNAGLLQKIQFNAKIPQSFISFRS